MAGDGCGGLWGCGGLRGAGRLGSALYCEHHDVQHKTRKSVNEQAFYMHDVGYRAEQRGLFHIFWLKIVFVNSFFITSALGSSPKHVSQISTNFVF